MPTCNRDGTDFGTRLGLRFPHHVRSDFFHSGLIAILVVATAVVACSVSSATADEWTTTQSGGSTIEVPQFFIDGPISALIWGDKDFGSVYVPDHPITLRQYRTESDARPYVYLTETVAAQAREITYEVDKDHLGVISGFADNQIFYAACRRDEAENWCIDIFYDAARKSEFSPIVDRIALSFINDKTGGS